MSRRRRKVIVLADPPIGSRHSQATAFPNLGLLYLAGSLRQHLPDFEVTYLDATVSRTEHIRYVRELTPAFYGLSYTSPYAKVAAEHLAAIKESSPRTFLLCGGAHPTSDPEGVLSRCPADAVVIGEGERTVVELIHAMLFGASLHGVKGIAFKRRDGSIERTPERQLVDVLDDIPPPAWELVDFRRFVGCSRSRGSYSTAIVASRGCPYDCVFCSNPVWKVSKPWFRARTPDNVAREVEALYQRGVREIYIRSDEMNADPDWAIAVFQAIAALRRPDLVLQCNLRAKPVSPALVDAMAQAGCWLCHIGIESGCQRVLDGVRKRITLGEIRDALALLHNRGIKTFGFFMLYQAWEDEGALHVESTAEVLQTLRLAIRLRRLGLLDYMSWSFATPYPHSALHRCATKFQLVRDSARARDIWLPWDMTLRLPGIATWEMMGMRALGMLVQGLLFFSDRDSYNPRIALVNLRSAVNRLRFAARV